MTTREWATGDPEPADHPPIVDFDGITWIYEDDGDDFGRKAWNRRHITRRAAGGGSVGPIGEEWAEVLDEYGPVREATDDERTNLTVTVA